VVKTLLKSGTGRLLALVALAMLAVTQPKLALAQAQAPATTLSIHGHVNNAAGQPIKTGEIKLSTDKASPEKDRKYTYSFPIDSNGRLQGQRHQARRLHHCGLHRRQGG
jgi:hypothetical protein